jgi:AcrR family transcriptional regulator
MVTQQERTETSRRALIDAALQIIGEEGYRALTTSRIEEVTGASRGLVGYHFGSKQGLTEAVIGHVQDAFVDHIVGLHGREWSSGIEGVLGLIHRYCRQLGKRPRRSRVILILTVESIAGQPALSDAIHVVNAVLRDSLRDQLLRGQGDGTIRQDVDPTVESVVLAGLLLGLTVQWLADPDGVDLMGASERAAAMAGNYRAP